MKKIIVTVFAVAFLLIGMSSNTEAATKTGWVKSSGHWYFYQSGHLYKGWLKSGKVWYYLDNSGVMKTGWVFSGGKWYYLNVSGAMQTGWQQISSHEYYFNSNGSMLTGTQQISGHVYSFNSNGWMVTGSQQTSDQNANGYLFYNGSTIEYVQMTVSGSVASGTITMDTPVGDADLISQIGAAQIRTDSYTFTGLKSGNSLTLHLNTHETVMGSFFGQNLTLEIPQTDGSLGQITLNPASIATYNNDLAALKATYNNLQVIYNKEEAVNGALIELSIDKSSLDKDLPISTENLSSMQTQLPQGKDLLAQINQEGQAVQDELTAGNVQWDQPSFDPEGFEQSDSNYQKMDQNVGALNNFVWALSQPGMMYADGLTYIDPNQMNNDIQKYSSDYANVLKDESQVPNYKPSPAIPTQQWVTNYIKTEQADAKTFSSNMSQIQDLSTQYADLANQAEKDRSQIKTAVATAAAAAKSQYENALAQQAKIAPQLLVTLIKGNTPGSTQICLPAELFPNQLHLEYTFVNSPTAKPNTGDSVPSGAVPYTYFSDINMTGNTSKYMDVYEVDGSGKITGFGEVGIISADILPTQAKIAPLLVTLIQGNTPGATQICLPAELFPNQLHLEYTFVNSPTAKPNTGDSVPSGAVPYTYFSDINMTGNTSKYMDVYEVDGSGKITGFGEVGISPADSLPTT